MRDSRINGRYYYGQRFYWLRLKQQNVRQLMGGFFFAVICS